MKKVDVAVIGSGMGGSAVAAVLAKLGFEVMLIERGVHPRFTIGESSTPVSSKKIRHIGNLYDIPEFVNMSTYTRMKEAEVDVKCGPKELFHYFVHDEDQKDILMDGQLREFIVQTAEVDAQYLRADSDEYFVEIAKKYGVHYKDRTSVENINFDDEGVEIELSHDEEKYVVNSEFVIDATGFKSIIGEKFDLKVSGDALGTPLKSRSIFAHFDGVNNFEKILSREASFVDRSPVPRDRATQHHCFEGGWMWVIPFEHGRVSIGLNLDLDYYPENDTPAEEEFWSVVEKFPLISELLEGNKNVMPFIKTGRMQFVNREMVGDRWAMLPASAYGLDAWFSTGLASAFMAVHRLADLLQRKVFGTKNFTRDALLPYELALKKEYHHVSRMVHGMYKSFKHFEVFKNYCSLCFMGAEGYMHKGGIQSSLELDKLLLNAGDEKFCDKFEGLYGEVMRLSSKHKVEDFDKEHISRYIREDMVDFNFRKFGYSEMYGVHPRTSMFSHL